MLLFAYAIVDVVVVVVVVVVLTPSRAPPSALYTSCCSKAAIAISGALWCRVRRRTCHRLCVSLSELQQPARDGGGGAGLGGWGLGGWGADGGAGRVE